MLRLSQAELDRSWPVVALELLEHEAGNVLGEAGHGGCMGGMMKK